MWYDELPPGKSWATLWSGYILCQNCSGIRPSEGDCPVCGSIPCANHDRPVQLAGPKIAIERRHGGRAVTISVNRQAMTFEGEIASGAEIKAAANVPGGSSLVLQEQLSSGTCRMIGDDEVVTLDQDSRFITIAPVAMGAEGRYEDWIYLQMLEREWKRPVTAAETVPEFPHAERTSPRAAIVVLFWTYFETRIERLLRRAMHNVPSRLAEDALQRYSSIGSRLDRFYRVLFETTYWADLTEMGFDDIRRHLTQVQERRNAFAHGDPKAIDETLVTAVVDNLKREHEAWITVFNRRAARPATQNTNEGAGTP
jgi:Multiubiquitin